MKPTIEECDTEIVVRAPYDKEFVEKIKSLPRDDRRWDASENAWIVDIDHEEEVVLMIKNVYGEEPEYV